MKKIIFFLVFALASGCIPLRASATVNEVVSRNDYVGNASTTVFPYTFKIFNKTDVEVFVNGVLKVVDSDYSVSGLSASGGGSITFVSAPAAAAKVAILRKQPQSQLSNYQPNEPFPASRIMGDFDKGVMLSQMQAEQLNRSLHVPKYTFPFTTEIDPTGRAGKCLGINSGVTGFTTFDCGSGGGGGGVGGTGTAGQLAQWISADTLTGVDEITLKGPRPWIDVRAYGTIQAAVDAAPSTGASIYIPGGSCFSISAEVTVGKSIRFFGDGAGRLDTPGTSGSCIRLTNATQNGFKVTTNDPVTFQDLQIYSTVATGGAGIVFDSSGIVSGLSGTQKSQLTNVTINGLYISVQRVSGLFLAIERSTFWACQLICLELKNTQHHDQGDAAISTATFEGGSLATGILWSSGGGLRITNAKFLGFLNGIALNPAWTDSESPATTTSDFIINGVSIENFVGNGILIVRTSGAKLIGNVQIDTVQLLGTGGATRGISLGTANTGYVSGVIINNVLVNSVGVGIGLLGGNTISVDNIQCINITTDDATCIQIGSLSAGSGAQIGHVRYTNVTNQVVGTSDPFLVARSLESRGDISLGNSNFLLFFRSPTLAATYGNILPAAPCLAGQLWKSDGASPTQTWACANDSGSGGGVATVAGTTNRISLSGTGADPIVDIAATYVGQTSLTTLGTVTTGTWNVPGTTINTGYLKVTSLAASPVASQGIVDYEPANNAARVVARGPDVSTNGQIRLITTRSDGSNVLTSIRIIANGNVGIGEVTTPGRLLHIGPDTGQTGVRIASGGSGTSDGGFLEFYNGGTFTLAYGTKSGILGGAFSNRGMTYSNNPYETWIAGSLRQTIDSSGVAIENGLEVGNPTGGFLGNGNVNAKGFFIDGVAVTAGGIIGTGVAGQNVFWTGASSVSGSNNNTWNNTTVLQTFTKATLNAQPLVKLSGTYSGDRTGLGHVDIPLMYGATPLEKSHVGGLFIDVTNTSSVTAGGSNDGVSSHGSIVRHNPGIGYSGFGIGSSVFMTSTRNSAPAGAGDNDTYGFLSFVRDASSANNLHVVGVYAQVTVATTNTGEKAAIVAVLSNHENTQANRFGIDIGNGDAVDSTTNYIAEAALNIRPLSYNGAGVANVESWQKAIQYSTRWFVNGSGDTTIAPTGNAVAQLTVTNTGANGGNVKLTGDGATTPSKTIRARGGVLEIMNNAYGAVILSLSDAGQLSVPGAYVSNSQTGITTTVLVRCEAATDKVRTLTYTGGLLTNSGSCA